MLAWCDAFRGERCLLNTSASASEYYVAMEDQVSDQRSPSCERVSRLSHECPVMEYSQVLSMQPSFHQWIIILTRSRERFYDEPTAVLVSHQNAEGVHLLCDRVHSLIPDRCHQHPRVGSHARLNQVVDRGGLPRT